MVRTFLLVNSEKTARNCKQRFWKSSNSSLSKKNRKVCKSLAFFSLVLPTSRMGYHGTPIESVVCCLNGVLAINVKWFRTCSNY